MKKLYVGTDLHGNNNYLGIIDKQGKKIFKKKLPNDPQVILEVLKPFQRMIMGIVVESTFNWYWLVDRLMSEGYKVHLANPAAIKQYEGKKHSDDKHDAFWLAEMLRLGILAEGYIYPKEERPIRDLLRKRGHLVRLRTSLILSLQNIISRNYGVQINANKIKRLRENEVSPILEGQEDLELSGRVSKEHRLLDPPNQRGRGLCPGQGSIERVLPTPSDPLWCWQDFIPDHHVGNRTDRTISQGGQLCVLLPEGSE